MAAPSVRTVQAVEGTEDLPSWTARDPDEVLDYAINWTTRLGGDTIVSSSWPLIPAGLTSGPPAPAFTTTATEIWLSGGTKDITYKLTNRVVTTAGRTMDQSVMLTVVDK